MKKILCLLLTAAMLIALVSCGSFDYENADYSRYGKIMDPKDITFDMLRENYNNNRISISKEYSQFTLVNGYAIDFMVSASVILSEDNGERMVAEYKPWTLNTKEDCVKGYVVGKEAGNAVFDNALIADVTKAEITSGQYRTIEYNKSFTFDMNIPSTYEDATVAGKTVAFTITPTAVYPTVYTDAELIPLLIQISGQLGGEKKTGEAVELGDIITIDFAGSLDGKLFDGGSNENYSMILGKASFVPGFEDALVGHTVGEKFTIDVTFPENYGTETLAGKLTEFEITIHKAYAMTDAFVLDKTEYKSALEFMEAVAIQYYSMFYGTELIVGKAEFTDYPSSLMKSYKKLYKKNADEMLNYYYSLYSAYYKLDEMKEILFPDGIDAYVDNSAKDMAAKDLVSSKILSDNHVSFDQKAYDEYVTYLAGVMSTSEKTYTAKDMEDQYGIERITVNGKLTTANRYVYEAMTCLPFALDYIEVY